jgi:ribosome modulation factor
MGKRARDLLQPIESCPFISSESFSLCWKRGWNNRDEELQGKFQAIPYDKNHATKPTPTKNPHQLGRLARSKGIPLGKCPFKRGPAKRSWVWGWRTKNSEMERFAEEPQDQKEILEEMGEKEETVRIQKAVVISDPFRWLKYQELYGKKEK